MTEEREVRQGSQMIVGELRIGVIGAGLADGVPAARLALREAHTVQDVVLFIGDRVDTLSKSVVLLSVTENDIAPGTGVAFLSVSDLTE